MITISYPDLALLGGLDPATGEVRGMSTSVYPDACFPQRNISVILIFFFGHSTLFLFLKTIDTLPPNMNLPLLSCDVLETLWGSYEHHRLSSKKLGFSCFTCWLSSLVLQPGKKKNPNQPHAQKPRWTGSYQQDTTLYLTLPSPQSPIHSSFNCF